MNVVTVTHKWHIRPLVVDKDGIIHTLALLSFERTTLAFGAKTPLK